MEYLIRECEPNDLNTLVQLCAKHAEYEKAHYVTDGKKDALAKALFGKDPVLKCMVVQVGGAVIGYSTYTLNYSTWDVSYFLHLDCLYLDDRYRSNGIGEEIIKKLIALAKQNNCVNLQWQTPIFNERAIKFYHRIGAVSKKKVRFILSVQ